MKKLIFALLLISAPVAAQEYSPLDQELWQAMVQALSEVPMSLNAHQQTQRILQSIQQQAKIRALQTKNTPKDATPTEGR